MAGDLAWVDPMGLRGSTLTGQQRQLTFREACRPVRFGDAVEHDLYLGAVSGQHVVTPFAIELPELLGRALASTPAQDR